MVTTPEKYMERLVEILQKKKDILLNILDLTRKQTEEITEDGLDALNKLIDGKQKKIDEIDKLDEEFGVYFQRLKSTLGISRLDQLEASKLDAAAAEKAKSLKSLTAEILDVIKSINKLEEINSRKSQELLGEFSKQIRSINQGKKANNAYKPTPYSAPSYFVDKKK
jgi:hypothetical protein